MPQTFEFKSNIKLLIIESWISLQNKIKLYYISLLLQIHIEKNPVDEIKPLLHTLISKNQKEKKKHAQLSEINFGLGKHETKWKIILTLNIGFPFRQRSRSSQKYANTLH